MPRRFREGTVVAHVATKMRQRDEDLARIRDHRAERVHGLAASQPQQLGQWRAQKKLFEVASHETGCARTAHSIGTEHAHACSNLLKSRNKPVSTARSRSSTVSRSKENPGQSTTCAPGS